MPIVNCGPTTAGLMSAIHLTKSIAIVLCDRGLRTLQEKNHAPSA